MEGCTFLRGDLSLISYLPAHGRIPKFTPAQNDGRRHGNISVLARERRTSLLRGCAHKEFLSSSPHWNKVGPLVSKRKDRWRRSQAANSGYAENDERNSPVQNQEDSSSEGGQNGADSARHNLEAFSQRMLEGAKTQVIVITDYFKNLDVEKVKSSLDVRKLRNLDVKKLSSRLDVRKLKNVDVNKLVSRVEEYTAAVPMPPYTRKIVTWVGVIFVAGIVIDTFIYRLSRMGARRKKGPVGSDPYDRGRGGDSLLSRTPSSLSMLLERDMRRKESVEWVNMVIGKLWNLYRKRMENMLVEILQPTIDELEKPDIVDKVEVQSFFLGDDPLTIRTVERRTSRRADDLQYHVGVRYTGGARLLLGVKLKWGIFSGTIPVGVRGLDVDAEVWVKIRMIPSEPWIGQATWAFVTLPRIKLALAPFRLVDLMDVPFLSMFLAKLLTEDLPSEFVRPNKNVVDFLQGQAVGPLSREEGIPMEGVSTFSGELSVTLVEARKVSYIPFIRTDPYCIFNLSEQVARSKRNSQTSLLGPPGAPVWNQDFKLLVVDNKTEHLHVTLHDTLGFTSYPVGSGDIDLRTLQDTVPVDRKLTLKSGWGPFPRRFAGEIILRLTYKAYIDEDEDGGVGGELIPKGDVVADVPGALDQVQEVATFFKEEAGNVAEFFEDKGAAKEALSKLKPISSPKDVEKALPVLGLEGDSKGSNKSSADGTGIRLRRTSSNGAAKLDTKLLERNGGARTGNPSDDGIRVDPHVEGQVIVSNTAGKRPNQSNVTRDEKPSLSKVLLWLTGATFFLWVLAADFNLADLFSN